MMNARMYLFAIVGLAAITASCGGAERPGPLKHHLDDMYIAQVPIAEKQEIIQAQQDFAVAKMERAKAEADLGESATELSVAKNEREQAVLDEKSANARKDAAEKSGDMNRVNATLLDIRAAELARKAADKKIEHVQAKREYLKSYLFYAEDQMYAQEARYELSKARLAQRKNIRPRGFEMKHYEQQAQDRSRFAQRTRAKIDQLKAKVENKRREWKALEQESMRARQPAGGTDASSTGAGTP